MTSATASFDIDLTRHKLACITGQHPVAGATEEQLLDLCDEANIDPVDFDDED